MLDAIEKPTDLLAAVEAWQPDAACLAAGDEYGSFQRRCYAGAGLSDAQINQRVLDQAGITLDADMPEHHEAAWAVARYCALMGLPLRQIIALLAYLAAEVPCWPEADDIGEIAEAAVAEYAA